jgi:two-component system, chemotaxis family, response regulator Rcp1
MRNIEVTTMKMPSSPPSRPLEILSVEDNPADVFLIKKFLGCAEPSCTITFVPDGEQALDYLFRRGRYSDAKRPDLILLDLNLPRKDGREVLKEIKADPELHIIPILILTSSGSEEDIRATYEGCANCYYVKPSDLAHFIEVMNIIQQAWIQSARLPERNAA